MTVDDDSHPLRDGFPGPPIVRLAGWATAALIVAVVVYISLV